MKDMAISLRGLNIAVLIPCFNEAAAVGDVVKDIRAALPSARVYVYDNNSTDSTAAVARAAGAIVRHEPLQGKGHVVRRMFSDIDADIYVLIDGDATYEHAAAPKLIETLVLGQFDMVNGVRVTGVKSAYRPGHRFGNWLLTSLVAWIFGRRTQDMLTGYRVFSRRFVKSFPALAGGFEIETELTVHALELRMMMMDVETRYKDRPAGSHSKLSTFRDGFRILRTIMLLLKEERPLVFFGAIGTVLAATAVGLMYPILLEYLRTGLVPRLPTAVLATGLMLSALLSLVCGLVLDTVTHGRREMKRLVYLQQPTTEMLCSQALRTAGANPGRPITVLASE
jgi:Glycosyl transferase family 2